MYFDSVLFYLATLINDISLMNLSNLLTVLLYISSPSFSVKPGLNIPDLFSNLSASIFFFIPLTTPLFRLPVFGIAKVEIFLVLSSFF